MVHGTLAQRENFLPPILRAETTWCQGFSEPDAGSDLANIQCTATVYDDELRVGGSKIWTTQGPEADWCFALVRTGARENRHRNLSFVLIDMHQTGIEIQPLVQLTGASEFSQVFFDDVHVPLDHVVGEINGGWRVAMTLLGAERAFAQLSRYGQYRGQLERLGSMITESGIDDSHVLQEFGYLVADVTGIRNLSLKIASLATAGEEIGALSSVTKLWWSTTHQRLVDLGYEIAVRTGMDLDFWFPLWLESRGETIYAGASQIQRNIISERLLGLPR
jgi:alkylation response protein AidB-like acyl-CoA dehydrogenase